MRYIALALLLLASQVHAQIQGAPAVPRCMIDQSVGNFHTGVSAAGDPVAILWCDDQLGLTYWGIGGNQAAANLSCLPNPFSWSLSYLQTAWTACITVQPNADQLSMIKTLLKLWAPHLAVQGPANQNVYTLKADGTRGPQLVIGSFGMQIAPGSACAGGRIANSGARYHDVSGSLSTNGVTLPAGSYALCQIYYPPAAGWLIS